MTAGGTGTAGGRLTGPCLSMAGGPLPVAAPKACCHAEDRGLSISTSPDGFVRGTIVRAAGGECAELDDDMEACGLCIVGEEDQRGSSKLLLLLTGMLRLLRASARDRRCSK